MSETCETCRWWRASDRTCHAAPPIRLPRKFDENATAGNRVRDESLIWGWPVCGSDDFCRTYEAKDTPHDQPLHWRTTVLTPEKIDELRRLLAKATPGPWEADNEKNDGCYGVGDDCHERFKSAAIHAPDGRGGYVKLFDALNSDAACIEEEWDEDGHYAWDEVSRANAALIVAMRNALPALLDLATASLAASGEGGELGSSDQEPEMTDYEGLSHD